MDRFGSSKLRIGVTLASLLLVGLILGGIRGSQTPDGAQLIAFGTPIPLALESLEGLVQASLARLVYTLVPLTMLLVGYGPLAERMRAERHKGLLMGAGFGALNGLFYSQILLLPVWAASARLMGNMAPGALRQADLNAVVLGLQLLLWAGVLSQVIKSSTGMALLLTLGLKEIGGVMAWGGEFLGELDVPAFIVKTMAFLGHLLPSAQLPSDPLAWMALPLSIGGPLLLGAALVALPQAKAKKK